MRMPWKELTLTHWLFLFHSSGPFEVGTKCEIQIDEFKGQKLQNISKDKMRNSTVKLKSAKLQANINTKVKFVAAEQETIHQFTVSKIVCKHSILSVLYRSVYCT